MKIHLEKEPPEGQFSFLFVDSICGKRNGLCTDNKKEVTCKICLKKNLKEET